MLVGLVIGIAIGLLLGPILRSWLVWREYAEASREARLHEEILRRFAAPTAADAEDGRQTGHARNP